MTDAPHASLLAMGLCTALGQTFGDTARAYAAGDRGFRRERTLVGADGLPPTLAQVIPIADCRDYGERLTRMFDAAVADVLAQTTPPAGGWRLRLVVSSGLWEQPGREDLRTALLERHAESFSDITFVAGGPAEALAELGGATRAVIEGAADSAAVGALDSLIHTFILDQLAAAGRMLTTGVGSGIIPGEAAAIAIVGAPEPGRPALGRLRGMFRGVEPEDVAAPKGVVGRGLAEAFQRAADFAPPDRLIADLDGERWRAEEFGFAVSRAANGEAGIAALAADPETPALHFGACGAATGLLNAALALADPPGPAAAGRLSFVSASSPGTGARTVGLIERAEAA